jgi:tetratricopeptide (TPR) repeat protein
VQLGYIYGALSQEFDVTGQQKMAARYRDLQLGIFQRVKDELSAVDYLTGDAASAIKGVGEVYAARGDFDQAIEYYRKALEIEPTYQYAWHDLFAAYDGLAREGRIDLDEMRLALQKTREFSGGSEPGTQVPGLDLQYLDSLEVRLNDWGRTVAARARAH